MSNLDLGGLKELEESFPNLPCYLGDSNWFTLHTGKHRLNEPLVVVICTQLRGTVRDAIRNPAGSKADLERA